MSFHVILCPVKLTWGMSPQVFIERIKAQWPRTMVKLDTTSGIEVDWKIPIGRIPLQGYLSKDGLTIGLDGHFCEDFAIFACWYRTIVPLEVPLVLADEDYTTIYPLTLETTPDDIISGRIARPAR